MSTQRSLSALIDRAKSILSAKTGQSNPAIDSIACAIAAVSYGQYSYQDQLVKELYPESCSEPWLYLHALRHSVDRLLPSFAVGQVLFEQISSVVTVPKGTRLLHKGLEFETRTEQLSDKPIDIISLISGSSSNLNAGVILTLTTGVSGINPSRVQCLGFSGGADIESIDHWRDRVIAASRKKQLIGQAEDYKIWAKSAHSDVDFAWALDNTPTRGMIEVYVGKHSDKPTLSDAVLFAVQNAFEQKRLAGCHPVAKHPSPFAIDIEIQGIEDIAVRDDVMLALGDLVKSKMGLYDKEKNKLESITPTEIILAVSKVASNYIVRAPTETQEINNNQIHVLGNVTWTAPN